MRKTCAWSVFFFFHRFLLLFILSGSERYSNFTVMNKTLRFSIWNCVTHMIFLPYFFQIDVWAAGVILYILLCGFPPFVSDNNDQEELFEDILSGQYGYPSPYWDDISEEAKDLISHMLEPNPNLRFSAEDVLDHPWLDSNKAS